MKILKLMWPKMFFLVFLMTFFNKISVAQEMWLNDSRAKTQAIFSKNEIQKTHTGKTNNGLYEYDTYEVGKDMSLSFYYKTDEVCDFISEVFVNKSDLIAAIQDLNKRFERVDSTHWITKDKITQIELQVNDMYFSVVYKKI